MGMDIKQIQDLIKFVSKSGVNEVAIEEKDFKITIKTNQEPTIITAPVQTVAATPVVNAAAPVALNQFAIFGSLFTEYVHGIKNPKVGLLNIGEEEEKGNMLTTSTYPLLKQNSKINFIGNSEGRDLFSDQADVYVCDGYTGNVVLKLAESFYVVTLKKGFKDDFFDRFNYERYGGSPILGVNAPVIIGHGISTPEAIKNMVLLSKDMVESGVIDKIKSAFN